ncbi:HOG (high osmolarity glycerol) pathway protein [Mortierella sp. GBA30]|nr:HOG (high osmolarity glycerol) pathway protein [Mortierella sp. GBA30]
MALPHRAGNALSVDSQLTKKRASIHYPEDSSMAKRMSLHFGPRCRSFSESWAFSAAALVPENPEQNGGSKRSSHCPSLLSFQDSSMGMKLLMVTGSADMKKETLGRELRMTSASSLRGEGDNTEHDGAVEDSRTSTVASCDEIAAWPGSSPSAGPSGEDTRSFELVITVRDFAYPKTHPYHLGQYPPEPEYEASDIEEDEIEEEDEDQDECEEDRTQGQARGLYDFDAENDTELSFREGDYLWIHNRKFPGWFLGEMSGKTGLVPENYVQLL